MSRPHIAGRRHVRRPLTIEEHRRLVSHELMTELAEMEGSLIYGRTEAVEVFSRDQIEAMISHWRQQVGV